MFIKPCKIAISPQALPNFLLWLMNLNDELTKPVTAADLEHGKHWISMHDGFSNIMSKSLSNPYTSWNLKLVRPSLFIYEVNTSGSDSSGCQFT